MGEYIKDIVKLPECFRQIDERLNGTAIHQDSQLLNEAVKGPEHTTKQQSLSKFEMNESQIEIQRLKSDIDTLNAYNRNLKRDNARIVSVMSENQKLRDELNALKKMNEQLTTKLSESSSALEHITDLSQRLRSRHKDIESELEELQAKLDAAEKAQDRYVCYPRLSYSMN